MKNQIDFINECGKTLPEGSADLIRRVLEETAREEGCPFPFCVTVSFVTKETIRERNRLYRGIDRVTDVLSFPLLSFGEPADFTGFRDRPDCFDPDTQTLLLGDIVICFARAEEQAAAYGHSLTREIAFLSVHSMLHLFGYDHESAAEAGTMEQKQETILQTLHITRE